MDTAAALKGKRNSVQPTHNSVLKNKLVIGEKELVSPAMTSGRAPMNIDGESEVESRH